MAHDLAESSGAGIRLDSAVAVTARCAQERQRGPDISTPEKEPRPGVDSKDFENERELRPRWEGARIGETVQLHDSCGSRALAGCWVTAASAEACSAGAAGTSKQAHG